PREPPARAVAGGAERALHRPLAPGEHEAARPHAARDEDRLPGLAVGRRNLVRPGRERAGRSLAVDADLAAAVSLEPGHVVRDVGHLPPTGGRAAAHR